MSARPATARPDQQLAIRFDYMLARYYSSSLGRFMAVDPGESSRLADPQRWNRYAYASNNPIAYVDPDGREQTVVTGGRTYMGGVDGMRAGSISVSGKQVAAGAKAVESAAFKAAGFMTGVGMVALATLQLPEAGAAFGGAGTAALIGIGASAVAAVADRSEANTCDLERQSLMEAGGRAGAALLGSRGMPAAGAEAVSAVGVAVVDGLTEGVCEIPATPAGADSGAWDLPPPEVRDAVPVTPRPSQPVMNALPSDK